MVGTRARVGFGLSTALLLFWSPRPQTFGLLLCFLVGLVLDARAVDMDFAVIADGAAVLFLLYVFGTQ